MAGDGFISSAIYGHPGFKAVAEEILEIDEGYFSFEDVGLMNTSSTRTILKRLKACGMIEEHPRMAHLPRMFSPIDGALWDIIAAVRDGAGMAADGLNWQQPAALPLRSHEWKAAQAFYETVGLKVFASPNRMCLLLWLAHRRDRIFTNGDALAEVEFWKTFRLLDHWIPLSEAGMIERVSWQPDPSGTLMRLDSPLWRVGTVLRRIIATYSE